MYKLALLTCAGALALATGFMITVETSDVAEAQMRRGGGGGGMFGGGGGFRGMGGGTRFRAGGGGMFRGGGGGRFRAGGGGMFRPGGGGMFRPRGNFAGRGMFQPRRVGMGVPFAGMRRTFNPQRFVNPRGMGKGFGMGPGPFAKGKGMIINRPGPGPVQKVSFIPRRIPGNTTRINQFYFSIFRGPRVIWWEGRRRLLIAPALIGPLFFAGRRYEPDGYVVMAEPVCRGVTKEGCVLRWRDVKTEEGDVLAQCVQYCPKGRKEKPFTTADDPPPPGADGPDLASTPMAQGCQVSIFSEPSLAGVSADATSDQTELATQGWDKQIASLEVKNGTWDFFTEANFGGDASRYAPGRYDMLENWDKQFSSFMCAQP